MKNMRKHAAAFCVRNRGGFHPANKNKKSEKGDLSAETLGFIESFVFMQTSLLFVC